MANERKGFKGSIGKAFVSPDNTNIPVEPGKPDSPVSAEGRGTDGLVVDDLKPTKPEELVYLEKPVKLTAEVAKTYAELLEREAFWERTTIKAILDEMLRERYRDRPYEPIPESKRPTKRGPKKKETTR